MHSSSSSFVSTDETTADRDMEGLEGVELASFHDPDDVSSVMEEDAAMMLLQLKHQYDGPEDVVDIHLSSAVSTSGSESGSEEESEVESEEDESEEDESEEDDDTAMDVDMPSTSAPSVDTCRQGAAFLLSSHFEDQLALELSSGSGAHSGDDALSLVRAFQEKIETWVEYLGLYDKIKRNEQLSVSEMNRLYKVMVICAQGRDWILQSSGALRRALLGAGSGGEATQRCLGIASQWCAFLRNYDEPIFRRGCFLAQQ